MALVHTVSLVLRPRRDRTAPIDTIIGWARDRMVTVLPDAGPDPFVAGRSEAMT
jgi:hypothetical protein